MGGGSRLAEFGGLNVGESSSMIRLTPWQIFHRLARGVTWLIVRISWLPAVIQRECRCEIYYDVDWREHIDGFGRIVD